MLLMVGLSGFEIEFRLRVISLGRQLRSVGDVGN
jgi:hypothetical protein